MDLEWFPFYWRDFDEATREMTNEEVGAYMRLLYYQWQYGSIPADRQVAARITGESLPPDLWDRLLRKFKPSDGLPDDRLVNDRMRAERDKAEALALRKSRAGRAGAKSRWAKRADSKEKNGRANSNRNGNRIDSGMREPMHNKSSKNSIDTSSQPDRSGSPRKAGGSRRSTRAPADFQIPDAVLKWACKELPGVDREALVAWMRRELEKLKDHEFRTPKSDWEATYRNWLRRCIDIGNAPGRSGTQDDEKKRKDILGLAAMFRMERREDESWESFEKRVNDANERRLKDIGRN